MTYVYILIILILLLFAYMNFETMWVQVIRVNFSKSRKGLKILHISDIHINLIRVPAEKISKIVKAENPDIIIISGDYIQKPVNATLFLDYLQKIKQNYKTYLCLGNHDYEAFNGNQKGLGAFIRGIEALHVEIMQNRLVQLEKNSVKYNLIGLDDLREGSPDFEKAVKDCFPADVNIAFSHNPDMVLELPDNRVDYFFCGHFHGGQIWMPFDIEFWHMHKDKLCKKGIKKGLHKVNGINIYINRGLGNVNIPLRFLSRPEITVYTMP